MSDKQNVTLHEKRLNIQVTTAMDTHLSYLAQLRGVPKSELVRDAVRAYLDEQEDALGSRKAFTKSFQRRMDHLDWQQSVQLQFLLHLLTLVLEQFGKVEKVDSGQLFNHIVQDTHHDHLQRIMHAVLAQKPKPPTQS